MKPFLVVGLFGVVTPLLVAPGCGSGSGAKERIARGGDGGTTVAMGDAGATDRAGNTSAMANGGSAGTATGEAGGSVGGDAGAAGDAAGAAGTAGTGAGSGGEAGENGASAGNGGTSGTSGSAGAGGSGNGTVTTACAFPNGGSCDEYTGTPEDAVSFESACAFAERLHLDACETASVSGICTSIQGAGTVRTFYYNLDPTELAEAEANCMAPWTWATP